MVELSPLSLQNPVHELLPHLVYGSPFSPHFGAVCKLIVRWMIDRDDLTKVDEPEVKKRREEMDDEERKDFDSWLEDIKVKRYK